MITQEIQEKVSYREFVSMMNNLQWIERDIEAEGDIISEDDYEEMINLWMDKGYARKDDIEFYNTFLTLLDEIVHEWFFIKFRDMKIDKGNIYEEFLERYYEEDEDVE